MIAVDDDDAVVGIAGQDRAGDSSSALSCTVKAAAREVRLDGGVNCAFAAAAIINCQTIVGKVNVRTGVDGQAVLTAELRSADELQRGGVGSVADRQRAGSR